MMKKEKGDFKQAYREKTRPLFAKIFAVLFSRLTMTFVVLAIELVYLVVIMVRFQQYGKWIEITIRLLTIFICIYIINNSEDPAFKIAWIVLIAVLPEAGALLYLLYGEKRPVRSLKRKIEPVEIAHREEMKQRADLGQLKSRRLRKTAQYVVHKGFYPAWDDTSAKYYAVGDTMFEDLIRDIDRAEHYIFLEYFIIQRGELWERIFDSLKKKVKEGVEVRIIYDDVGSMGKTPRHFVRSLKEAGIQVMSFNTLKPILSLIYNTRDHRKIAVIDGYIGYTGGANIADEYANLVVRFGHWKDCGIRLEGEGVWNLTVMFLNMWNAFRRDPASYSRYETHRWHPEPFEGDGFVQPFSDTPLDYENLSENIYIDIIDKAQSYVYIYTPYFIPSNSMENALTLAAKRGVDVRIVTPGIPDKVGIYAVTRSFYKQMMKAGVKIYEYTPGFLHSKCFVSDGDTAVVGTINLDFRSLYLHFEDGVLLLENQAATKELYDDFRETFRKSRRILMEDTRRHPFASLYACIVRVLCPLL